MYIVGLASSTMHKVAPCTMYDVHRTLYEVYYVCVYLCTICMYTQLRERGASARTHTHTRRSTRSSFVANHGVGLCTPGRRDDEAELSQRRTLGTGRAPAKTNIS